MTQILTAAYMGGAVGTAQVDRVSFDCDRPNLWQALRTEYPTRLDHRSMKEEQLEEKKNPTACVQRQLKRWKQETDKDSEGDPVMTTLFREKIMDAMPPAVKNNLQNTQGVL